MSTWTPERHQLALSALERANEVRNARAELKHRLASGDVFAASVILDPPREARTWKIGELLTSQRHWGVRRMRKLLWRLEEIDPVHSRIPETKPAGMLTERQRRMLAEALRPGSEDA